MSTTLTDTSIDASLDNYTPDRDGFRSYLYDLADELFPFPGYRESQDEILYESLEALFIDGYQNIIIEGPTGIGKSPINVTLGRVVSHLAQNKRNLEGYFNYQLTGIDTGKSFYTTPQKQLRNQLSNDEDLTEYVTMLKSRADYICGESGDNCKECTAPNESKDATCRTLPGCTYWSAKVRAMRANISVLTFAMLVVDNYIPPEDENGEPLSFDNRDIVIVDEGHNLESQVAGLFAGFNVSPWQLPDEVYGDTDDRIRWSFERFEDVREILGDLVARSKEYIKRHDENPEKEALVDKCENFVQKAEFAAREVKDGRPWVVTVSKLADTNNKKLELKPVDVDNFLQKFIWSRGNKRVISSATIPYRENISTWADRLGLDGSTKLISRPMPFPEENRLIHTDTMVGSLSGDGEDEYWNDVIQNIEEIHSQHAGEKGLIHTTSYKRANELADDLGRENVIVQNRDWEKDDVIENWYNSEKDILLSPSMMEGVDLYDDRCRWQILVKIPYGYIGDERVSYLLNERYDWKWYNQMTMLDVMQSVGRAVRGPEDYASFYVIDGAFTKLMGKVTTPTWFNEAVRE